MALTLILILLGAALGGLVPSLWAWYFVGTREYRRARNLRIIGLGQVFVIGISLGSLLLMFKAQEWLGIAPYSSQRRAALYAYTASFVCGAFLLGRNEVRWRKSVGLDDKSLMLKQRNKT